MNRAGEKLALASADDADLPIEACEVAATWRELHAEPLVWLTMSIRGRVETPVSYRLKRLPQIATKLARSGNMALRGCRTSVVVASWSIPSPMSTWLSLRLSVGRPPTMRW